MRDMVEMSPMQAGPDASPDAGSGPPGRPGVSERDELGSRRAVQWRRFGFDYHGTSYSFETTRNGDRSRIVINGKAALELPRPVWGALFEAVAVQQGTARAPGTHGPKERATSLPLAGAAWDPTEDDQLRAAWASGADIADLAVLHQRSRGAITSRLQKLGITGPQGAPAAAPSPPAAH